MRTFLLAFFSFSLFGETLFDQLSSSATQGVDCQEWTDRTWRAYAADDFLVPERTYWELSGARSIPYQFTGSQAFDGINVFIFRDDEGLPDTTNPNDAAFRLENITSFNSSGSEFTVDLPGWTLGPGRYWLVFQLISDSGNVFGTLISSVENSGAQPGETIEAAYMQTNSVNGQNSCLNNWGGIRDRCGYSSLPHENLALALEGTAVPAGITLGGTPLGNITEGQNKSFTVVLDAQPMENVTVAVSIANANGQATISQGGNLTFTSANWNTPQTVTVAATQDQIDENNLNLNVGFAVTSADSAYNGLTLGNEAFTVVDDDTAGFTLSTTTLGNLSEPDGSGTFTVVLTSQPTANVTIDLSSNLDDDIEITPDPLTFTTGNWNNAQTVTVSVVDDAFLENNEAFTITLDPASGDSFYNGLSNQSVTGTVIDDDIGGITLTQVPADVSEGGGFTFAVALSSAPTGGVTVTVTPSLDPDALFGYTFSPTAVTFTAANYVTAKTITLTLADDDDCQGLQSGSGAPPEVTLTVTGSGGGGYTGITNNATFDYLDDEENDIRAGVDPDLLTLVLAENPTLVGADGFLSACEAADLSELDVPGGSLTSLKGIGYFTGLERVILSGHQIRSLTDEPIDLSGLSSLTHLDLSDNFLGAFFDTDDELPAGEGLNWSDFCTIEDGSFLHLPATITFLNLSGNLMRSLPDLPSSLSNLDLANNLINDLAPLVTSSLGSQNGDTLDLRWNSLLPWPDHPQSMDIDTIQGSFDQQNPPPDPDTSFRWCDQGLRGYCTAHWRSETPLGIFGVHHMVWLLENDCTPEDQGGAR